MSESTSNPFETTTKSSDELSKPSKNRNPVVWGVLAIVAAIPIGMVVNISLVNLGPIVIPLPEGADVSSMDKLAESMKLMKPANFLFPYLGHALGTLVGAFVAASLAIRGKLWSAIGIGAFFQAGGIAAVSMLGGPTWFNVLDLTTAYFPMAFLGYLIAAKLR